MLIWNDSLSGPALSTVAWRLPSKRQLAGIGASNHVVDAVSRGTEGAACGAKPQTPCPRHGTPTRR
jgi:hypothetical protein